MKDFLILPTSILLSVKETKDCDCSNCHAVVVKTLEAHRSEQREERNWKEGDKSKKHKQMIGAGRNNRS